MTSIIGVFTLSSLLYVHQQVNLLKLSYSIKTNEQTLEMLVDQNQLLKYNVASLKSPQVLEEVMIAKNIELLHPEQLQLIHMEYTGLKKQTPHTQIFAKAFSRLFSLKRTAIAGSAQTKSDADE